MKPLRVSAFVKTSYEDAPKRYFRSRLCCWKVINASSKRFDDDFQQSKMNSKKKQQTEGPSEEEQQTFFRSSKLINIIHPSTSILHRRRLDFHVFNIY